MPLSFDDLLSKSCGQVRPITLLASFIRDKKITEFTINKPYAIIGRHASCDISLPHLELSKQHAYLQVLDGRLFCVDQASRTGIFWKDKPRLYGWLDAGEWIKVGPYRITLKEPVGKPSARASSARSTAPFLMRYKTLPRTDAQLVLDGSRTLPLQSQMIVIGRSKYCNLELEEESVSRVHASIVKTIDGKYWLVELMSRIGVKINGKHAHSALLNHNDIIKIGSYTIQFQDVTPLEISQPIAEPMPPVLITPMVVSTPLEPTLQEIPVLASLDLDDSQAAVPTVEPKTVALTKDAVTLPEPIPYEEPAPASQAVEPSHIADVELPVVPESAAPALDVEEPSAEIPLKELEDLVSVVLADDAGSPAEVIPLEEPASDSNALDVMQPGEISHNQELVSLAPELDVAYQVVTDLPEPVALVADAVQTDEPELPLVLESVEPALDVAEEFEAAQPTPADPIVDSTLPTEVKLLEEPVPVEPALRGDEQSEVEKPVPAGQAIDLSQPAVLNLHVTPVPPEQSAASRDQTEIELPVPIVQAVAVCRPSEVAPTTSADVLRAGQHLVLQPAPSLPCALVVQKQTDTIPAPPARAIPIPSHMIVRPRSSLAKPKGSVFVPPHVKLAPPAVQHHNQLSNHFTSDDFGLMDGLMQCMKQMQQEMMSQMRMNMEMMAEFMGNLQKQQAEMIRDELAQLGNLNKELIELRQSLLTAAPSENEAVQRQLAAPAKLPVNAKAGSEATPGKNAKVPGSKKKMDRPNQSADREATTPVRSHAWISQRISCLEQERLSRWEKMKTAVMGK